MARRESPRRWSLHRNSLAGLDAAGSRWLTFGGGYNNHRHSPLTQITPENVTASRRSGCSRPDTLGRFETTPLLRDNVLYVTGPLNLAWALDARTGREIWRYKRELPPSGSLTACCGLVNKGFGMWATGCSSPRSMRTW